MFRKCIVRIQGKQRALKFDAKGNIHTRKIDKLYLIEIKIFCSVKHPNRMKKKATKLGENICEPYD